MTTKATTTPTTTKTKQTAALKAPTLTAKAKKAKRASTPLAFLRDAAPEPVAIVPVANIDPAAAPVAALAVGTIVRYRGSISGTIEALADGTARVNFGVRAWHQKGEAAYVRTFPVAKLTIVA